MSGGFRCAHRDGVYTFGKSTNNYGVENALIHGSHVEISWAEESPGSLQADGHSGNSAAPSDLEETASHHVCIAYCIVCVVPVLYV